jgi:SAM-dependent methyltransferase
VHDPAEAAARYVAAAAVAARELGIGHLDELAASGLPARRVAPLVALLGAANRRDVPASAPGAALIAEVVRRDRAFDPHRDPWSLQLDARALAPAALLSVGAANVLASRIVPLLPADGVLLDAGGGLGDVTRAVLAASPTARVVLVDVPAVAHAARAAIADPRADVVGGDLRTLALPACDVAVLSNVLHLHDAATAAELVTRVARAVKPGGAIVIKDVVRDVAGHGTLRALAFALAAAIFDDRGAVHATADLVAWLSAPCEIENPLPGVPECALVVSRTSR